MRILTLKKTASFCLWILLGVVLVHLVQRYFGTHTTSRAIETLNIPKKPIFEESPLHLIFDDSKPSNTIKSSVKINLDENQQHKIRQQQDKILTKAPRPVFQKKKKQIQYNDQVKGGLIKRKGEFYKRSGSSFSKDLRRKPAIFAEDLNTTDWLEAFKELTDDLKAVKKDFRCSFLKSRGNWWDCDSYPFSAKKPCLVYSFGIDNDYRFDDAMAELGCEVHSFDPSMKIEDHVRDSGVNFHNIGIGSRDDNSFHPWSNEYTRHDPDKIWRVKRMSSIMSELGHRNMSLDILKLDIEGYEWEVLDNILLENLIPQIKQLEVEYHIFPHFPAKENYVNILKVYQTLWALKFKRYYTLVHQFNAEQERHLQADVAYVNTEFSGNF